MSGVTGEETLGHLAFREGLESALHECGIGHPTAYAGADAILAMPEMQAIKEALELMLDETPMGCPYLLQDGSDGSYGPNTCNQGCRDEPECMTCDYPRLPASVVEWARS